MVTRSGYLVATTIPAWRGFCLSIRWRGNFQVARRIIMYITTPSDIPILRGCGRRRWTGSPKLIVKEISRMFLKMVIATEHLWSNMEKMLQDQFLRVTVRGVLIRMPLIQRVKSH